MKTDRKFKPVKTLKLTRNQYLERRASLSQVLENQAVSVTDESGEIELLRLEPKNSKKEPK